MSENPTVSVIIPTYERVEFLSRAIDSVLALASWIGRRYRAGVGATMCARRLDASVIPPKTAAKYLVAGALPSAWVDSLRERARPMRRPQVLDSWLDL